MDFHEVQFPAALSFGSVGGPERRTEVVTLANGFEERNTPWVHSRRRYDAGVGAKSLDDIETLIGFFEARRGQLYGFRWKDWADFKSCASSTSPYFDDQTIGQGDGVETNFQLMKTYEFGSHAYQRPVAKPVAGSVRVSVAGVELTEGADWSVDLSTGVVSFAVAPALDAVIAAGFEFDVPVRFAEDSLQISLSNFQAGELPAVPVVEVRL